MICPRCLVVAAFLFVLPLPAYAEDPEFISVSSTEVKNINRVVDFESYWTYDEPTHKFIYATDQATTVSGHFESDSCSDWGAKTPRPEWLPAENYYDKIRQDAGGTAQACFNTGPRSVVVTITKPDAHPTQVTTLLGAIANAGITRFDSADLSGGGGGGGLDSHLGIAVHAYVRVFAPKMGDKGVGGAGALSYRRSTRGAYPISVQLRGEAGYDSTYKLAYDVQAMLDIGIRVSTATILPLAGGGYDATDAIAGKAYGFVGGGLHVDQLYGYYQHLFRAGDELKSEDRVLVQTWIAGLGVEFRYTRYPSSANIFMGGLSKAF